MLVGIGAMKSYNAAVKPPEDERPLTYADVKPSHEPAGMMPAAVRLMAASPNCWDGRSTDGLSRFSATVEPLV
jgi:hypothetical protein